MKSQRTLLILGLILILAGALTWKFFAKDNSMSTAITATPLSASVKQTPPMSQVTVEAPKAAPAVPKEATPHQPSEAERAAVEALAAPLRQKQQQILDVQKAAYDARLAAGPPDEASRAKFDQQMQLQKTMIDRAENNLSQMANPPQDIGAIALIMDSAQSLSSPQTFTLSTGETFTLRISYQPSRGTEIMLSQTMASGHGTSNQRVIPTPGQPMVMLLNDGTLIKFTPTGTVIPPKPVDNSPPLPDEPPPKTWTSVDDGSTSLPPPSGTPPPPPPSFGGTL